MRIAVNVRAESMRAVADKASTPRGVLALGANRRDDCLYVLPEIFAEYHRLYPAVQISTSTETSATRFCKKSRTVRLTSAS